MIVSSGPQVQKVSSSAVQSWNEQKKLLSAKQTHDQRSGKVVSGPEGQKRVDIRNERRVPDFLSSKQKPISSSLPAKRERENERERDDIKRRAPDRKTAVTKQVAVSSAPKAPTRQDVKTEKTAATKRVSDYRPIKPKPAETKTIPAALYFKRERERKKEREKESENIKRSNLQNKKSNIKTEISNISSNKSSDIQKPLIGERRLTAHEKPIPEKATITPPASSSFRAPGGGESKFKDKKPDSAVSEKKEKERNNSNRKSPVKSAVSSNNNKIASEQPEKLPESKVMVPSIQFYYETFTEKELIAQGVFDDQSASHFLSQLISSVEAEDEISWEEEEPKVIDPPNVSQGICVLGF